MTWLADVLKAGGLKVAEAPGWKTRGKDGIEVVNGKQRDNTMRPRVVIAHHTATNIKTSNSIVEKLLINGRSDLAGPLCHLGLRRDGTYVVIASGKANHAGAGRWEDANESVEAIGIEAYNSGLGETWPQVQLDAYDQGSAVLLNHIGRDQRAFCGHREWATPPGRKPDPKGIDLPAMRARIGILLVIGDIMDKLTAAEIAFLKEMIAGVLAINSNPTFARTLILDFRARFAAANPPVPNP